MGFSVSGMNADLLERYEERAVIMEFDGGIPRAEAEKLALQDVLSNSPSLAAQGCLQDARYGTKARRSAGGG